jgi:hypothetical protein
MRRVVFLLPLLFAGCSCQPDADEKAAPARPAPIDVSAASAEPTTPAGDGLAAAPPPALSAVAPDAVSETTTVRNYVIALLGSDRASSDAYWSGGRTGSRPDDAVLRTIPQLRNLRVDTDSPIARDTAQPSRLREVPVRIRATSADGTFNYHGWYRLQPRPDGSGWEIHSASLQPTLR